jgi:hypothetical protein
MGGGTRPLKEPLQFSNMIHDVVAYVCPTFEVRLNYAIRPCIEKICAQYDVVEITPYSNAERYFYNTPDSTATPELIKSQGGAMVVREPPEGINAELRSQKELVTQLVSEVIKGIEQLHTNETLEMPPIGWLKLLERKPEEMHKWDKDATYDDAYPEINHYDKQLWDTVSKGNSKCKLINIVKHIIKNPTESNKGEVEKYLNENECNSLSDFSSGPCSDFAKQFAPRDLTMTDELTFEEWNILCTNVSSSKSQGGSQVSLEPVQSQEPVQNPPASRETIIKLIVRYIIDATTEDLSQPANKYVGSPRWPDQIRFTKNGMKKKGWQLREKGKFSQGFGAFTSSVSTKTGGMCTIM